MKIWCQSIVAAGILFVSAASLSYTWTVARAYLAEKEAERLCGTEVESTYPLDAQMELNACVREVLGVSSINETVNALETELASKLDDIESQLRLLALR